MRHEATIETRCGNHPSRPAVYVETFEVTGDAPEIEYICHECAERSDRDIRLHRELLASRTRPSPIMRWTLNRIA